MVGPARPPGMGPGPWSGCFGFPNWVLGSTHGLQASALALGAGTKALFFPAGCLWVVCGNDEAGGQSPGQFFGWLPGGFPSHAEFILWQGGHRLRGCVDSLSAGINNKKLPGRTNTEWFFSGEMFLGQTAPTGCFEGWRFLQMDANRH